MRSCSTRRGAALRPASTGCSGWRRHGWSMSPVIPRHWPATWRGCKRVTGSTPCSRSTCFPTHITLKSWCAQRCLATVRPLVYRPLGVTGRPSRAGAAAREGARHDAHAACRGVKRMAKQQKSLQPKITIIPGRGVSQTINYLLKDRDELDWLVAVGRNKEGEIFFYDTGGDIIEDLGTLEYLKERIARAHFGDEPE